MPNTINLNRETARRLEAATKAAGKAGEKTFVFDGHELLVGYAEYLLEHASNVLGLKPAITAAGLRAERGAA